MEMFFAPLPFVFIVRSLFVLRECALMLVVSTTAAKLLKQGYRYHKIRKAFSTFYRIHLELIVNNIGLKNFCNRVRCNVGSEQVFHGDLVIIGKPIKR